MMPPMIYSSFQDWLSGIGQSFGWLWKAIGIVFFLSTVALLVFIVIKVVKDIRKGKGGD